MGAVLAAGLIVVAPALPASADEGPLNPGAVSTVAGSGSNSDVDGTGTGASFGSMGGTVVTGGFAYQTVDSAVRKINLTTTLVSTLAGSLSEAGYVDSTDPSLVRFGGLRGITTDGTYLYVSDVYGIRRVTLATGTTSTLVGLESTVLAFGPDGYLYSAGGRMYEGSYGPYGYGSIKKINVTNGSYTTFSSLTSVQAISIDDTYLWATSARACGNPCTVDLVRVALSDGTTTTMTAAQDVPGGGGLASAGDYVYSGSYGSEQRKLIRYAKSDGSWTSIAGVTATGYADGTGTNAWFSNIRGIATDGTSLWVADTGNHRLRKVVTGTALPSTQSPLATTTVAIDPGAVSTFAGSGADSDVDGTGTGASFGSMGGTVVVGGFAYQTVNSAIRKVNLTSGAVSTLAGSLSETGGTDSTDPSLVRFGALRGITTDGTYLYVSDTYGIRRVSLATGATSTVVGLESTVLTFGPDGYLYSSGSRMYENFYGPYSYGQIKKINVTNGTYTTFVESLSSVQSIASDGTYLWVTQAHTCANPCLMDLVRVTLSDGTATTMTAAHNVPGGGGLISAGGYLYGGSHGSAQRQLIRYDKTDGTPTSIAGTSTAGYADGTGTGALFSNIRGLASDGVNLWVADTGNHRLRRLVQGVVPPEGGDLTFEQILGGSNPAIPGAACCHGQTSRPVDTASGNFWHTFADLSIPGRGPAIDLTRTYNSLVAGTDGPFGFGWSFPYGMSLTNASGVVTIAQENGSQVTFTESGGDYVAAPRVVASLVHNGDGSWTFTRKAREVITFDSSGRLSGIGDLNGEITTLSYPAGQLVVTDPAGRTLTLSYTGAHITSAADSASPSRTLTYTYDGAGNLTDVVDIGGGHWQFTYDGSHRMLTMREPKYFGDTTTSPSPVTTNHYDGSGRVDWQSDPLGRTTTFDYTTVPGSTIVTDPKGNVTKDTYEFGLRMSMTRGYGTPQAATWTYTYDPDTLSKTSVTDPNGHVWSSTYDADGNKLSSTDPLTRTSSATYNAFNEPLTITDGKNVTTTMTYDGNGNLLTRSTPWAEGPPSTNQVTTYHYDDSSHPGDVTSMTDPAGKTWTYTYDTAGNKVTTADPLGNTSRTCYDEVGRPTAMISPRGVAGGVTCATAPPAAHTSYFTYNAYGDVLTSKDPLGHTTTRTYNANRRPATVLDPAGQTTTYMFDPAGQPTQTLRPDSTVVKTDFWEDGSIKTQRDAANQHSDYAYDSQGRLTSITDPLGRVTSFGYDAAGNRTSKQDPGGNCAGVPKTGCTTFTFDDANQLTGIDYSDASTPDVSEITYDGVGHRTAMTDGSGTSTYTWDSLGRMTSSVAPSGTVGYTWDLRNLQTGLAYPNSIGSVTRVFDDAGRLSSITDWLSHTTSYGYDGDGNLTSQTNPNGTKATITVDNADRVMGVSHAPTSTPGSPFASFSYGRDNEDKLTSVTSTGVPADNHTWGYSTIDQVTTDTAKPYPYAYDAADNLTQLQDGSVQAFDVANQLTSSKGRISRVGTGGTANSNSASAVVTLPAGIVANDQILVSATFPANRTVTTPSGYTLVGSWSTGSNSSNTKMSLFRKTAAGTETSVTVTFSATVAKTVTAAVYRGVNTTTPIEVSSNATSSTNTVMLPSVSPMLANSQLVAVLGATQGSVAAAVWTAPTGMVKQVEQSIASTDGAIADQRLTAAGATGTRTATLGTTGKLVGVLLALKPAVTTFGYDTRGNRTTRTAAATTIYGYNQANRLVSHANGTTTTYTYNGDGLRVGRGGASPTTFRWDLTNSAPNLLVDGTTAYVYGPDGLPIEQVNGSTVLYYHHDQLGSTRAVTNSTGTVVATYSYDAYGNSTGSTGAIANPFGFAGEYRDTESGLVYLRARHYDPATGQFLTRDPIEAVTRSAYGYVAGNPLNGVDPTGMNWLSDRASDVGSAVAGGAEVVREAAQDTGEFVVRNRDTIASLGAVGVCGLGMTATFGAAAPVCVPATVAALGISTQKSVDDNNLAPGGSKADFGRFGLDLAINVGGFVAGSAASRWLATGTGQLALYLRETRPDAKWLMWGTEGLASWLSLEISRGVTCP